MRCDSVHRIGRSFTRSETSRSLSLFRVLASSIFNLSRVELINEIIECSYVFFFSIYEAAISEWNADYANEALIKIFCPLPLRNLDKRTCCNYKAFWSERFPHVEKFLAATQNRRDTFESVRGRWLGVNKNVILKCGNVLRLTIVESVVHSSRELLGARAPLYRLFFKGDIGHFYVLTCWYPYVVLRRRRRRPRLTFRNSLWDEAWWPENLFETTAKVICCRKTFYEIERTDQSRWFIKHYNTSSRL